LRKFYTLTLSIPCIQAIFFSQNQIHDESIISGTIMKRIILLGILFTFGLIGCGVYTPQTVDIPLINKKNELRADAGISYKEFFYVTISYGLTDKIALQTFFNKGAGPGRFFFQNAVGYFRDLGNKKIMEVYSGFAYGHTDAGNHDVPTRLKGPYQLYFTQFNFGKIDNQFANADFGIGIKAGFLHSNLENLNYFTHYSPYFGPYEPLVVNSFLLEPNVFLRIGGEKLKFSLKLGSRLHYQFINKDKKLPIDKLNIGLGLNYRF